MGPGLGLTFAAYLFGSLPFVYLLGRWRGLDLRTVGSRNIGGTNLWQRAGAPLGLLGGLLDAAKGVLPVVAGKALGMDLAWVALAGLAGVAGQMWPLFLKFKGGRGVAAGMGFAFTLGLWQAMVSVSVMLVAILRWGVPHLRSILGRRCLQTPHTEAGDVAGASLRHRLSFAGRQTHMVPVSMLASFASAPLLTWLLGRETEVVLGCLGLLVLIVGRRVSAELRADMAQGSGLGGRLWHRLLYDRAADEG